jgi:hypothetical protein
MKSYLPVTLIPMSLIASSAISAQDTPVQSPVLKVGDAWVFDDVSERGTAGFSEARINMVVERLGGETMTVGVKREGAPTAFEDHIVGADWSQRRLVDGQQTVTTRPLQFPMNVGRKWTVEYVDATRRGNQLSAHIRRTYSVAGWVDVTVPAGHFHAIEIVAEGTDEGTIEVPSVAGATAMAASSGSTSISHAQRGGVGKLTRVTHAEFYYVPEVKNWVKSVEEQYNTDNVRLSRQTRSLVSFTPSP